MKKKPKIALLVLIILLTVLSIWGASQLNNLLRVAPGESVSLGQMESAA
jgi:hypothetical protein